jgi:hypothetical protein
MPEKLWGYREDEIVLGKVEQPDSLSHFLSRLGEITGEVEAWADKEEVSSLQEDKPAVEFYAYKGIERSDEKAENIRQNIIKEGLNRKNLNDFLENVMRFTHVELQNMIATIDDLIREWDPSMTQFLQDLKKQLQIISRIRSQPDCLSGTLAGKLTYLLTYSDFHKEIWSILSETDIAVIGENAADIVAEWFASLWVMVSDPATFSFEAFHAVCAHGQPHNIAEKFLEIAIREGIVIADVDTKRYKISLFVQHKLESYLD